MDYRPVLKVSAQNGPTLLVATLHVAKQVPQLLLYSVE